jgi:GrpB-like predicted nucleotidyltransferase (UPF0157 family)
MADDPNPALGLRRGTSVVRAYDPRWAQEFAREEPILRRALGDLVSGIEHIGSTAVPGLAAKPVLDIAVALVDPSTFAAVRQRLVTCGYEHRGDLGSEGGHVFAKGPETARSHYLHVQEAGSTQWRRYLAFRDMLRNDPVKRDDYAALKQDLARRFPTDRRAYLAGKAAFIADALSHSRVSDELVPD